MALVTFLVVLGLAGYLSFWAYYFHRVIGIIISVTAISLALGAFIRAWQTNRWQPLWISHQLLLPVSTYTFFILFIGCFSCHYFDGISSIAANRWLNLPPDNWIPKCFADQLWNGKIATPMFGDWLSSDRPPLQTGLYLLLYPIKLAETQNSLFYQVVSSMLQAFCFLPVFVLIKKEKARISLLILVALGMTGFMAVHTLFVWPKLLAATYVFLFYLVIMTSFGKSLARKT